MGGSAPRLSSSEFPTLPGRTSSYCFHPKAVASTMAFAAINAAGIPIAAVEEAFATEPSLKKRVYDAIGS